MEKKKTGQTKIYHTKNPGYTAEEKKLIRSWRKCSYRERRILAVLVEKTAAHMTDLEDLDGLIRK